MAKEKLSPEEKAKIKLQKIEEKKAKKAVKDKMYKDLKEGYEAHEKESKTKEYVKKQKVRKEKEKFDFKLAFKEMPAKMIKEVNKITWPKSDTLWMKFLWVIIFMICFGIFFYFVDWGLQALFSLAHIV